MRAIRLTGTSRRATICSRNCCAAAPSRRGAGRARTCITNLPFDFLDAVNGATNTITLPQGGTLNVTIPAGVEDGQTLRLRGKGAPSPGEGPPGDALVQIVVKPHRYFTREGDDILLDLPITREGGGAGGGSQNADDDGKRHAQNPEAIEHRRRAAPPGQGREDARGAGDELVKLKVMMPTEAEPELDAFLADWKPAASYDPRKEM